MTFVDALEAPGRKTGQIKLHGAEAFAGMRRAGRLTAEALDMLTAHVRPGVTTEAIDQLVFDFAMAHGAYPAPLDYRGYRKSICTSLNHVVCHGLPDNKPLKDGDIVNIDVTLIVEGWHGDSSRMYLVGDVPRRAQRLVEVTHEALLRGIAVVRDGRQDRRHRRRHPGISPRASAVRSSATSAVTGSGGCSTTSRTSCTTDAGARASLLKAGMFFTIEPMINLGRPARENPVGWLDGRDPRPFAVGAIRTHARRHRRTAARSSPTRPPDCTSRPMPSPPEADAPPAGDKAADPHFLGHRERLRERFRRGGNAALNDYEFLELILFRADAAPRREADRQGDAGALRLLSRKCSPPARSASPRWRGWARPPSLETQDRRGGGAAARAVVHREAAQPRLVQSAVLDYCRTAMAFLDHEEFRILFLDKKNQLLADEVQGVGTVDHAPGLPARGDAPRARSRRHGADPGAQPSRQATPRPPPPISP